MSAPLGLRKAAPTLYLRTPTGEAHKVVRYASLAYVEKANDVGKWAAVLPLNADTLWSMEPGWGIIAVENGKTVLSGQVGGPDQEPKVYEPAGRTPGRIELAGVDDNDWIARNLAWPVPANDLSAQTSGYDVRSGIASTVLLGYANANIGPAARPERRQTRVVLDPDPVIGATISEQARFDSLLEISQSVARKGGIGFRARADLDGAVHLSCYQPRDLSADIRFSTALGNATDVQWSRQGGVSDLIGGGQGDLDARTFVVSTDAATRADWGYREGFYDYRNADPAQLQADTDAKRLEQAPTRVASFTPLDTPSVQFDRDYALGDIVTFQTVTAAGTQSWAVPILEVERVWTRQGGRKVTPRAGDSRATATTRQRLRERELLRRVERLERGA